LSEEEENIVGVGPEKTCSFEHVLILLDVREGQRDALIQITSHLVWSFLGYYLSQPIPPTRND